MRRALWIMAGGIALALASAAPAVAAESNDCPNGGTVRLGVEPYDTAARLVPIYKKVGKLIGEKLGCKVEVFVATSYNAEIEAMRNGSSKSANSARSAMCSPVRWRRPRRSPRLALRTVNPTATGPAS